MTDFIPGYTAIGEGSPVFNPPGPDFAAWLNAILKAGAALHWTTFTEDTGVSITEHGGAFALAGWELVVDPANVLTPGWYCYVKGPGLITPDDGDPVTLADGEWAVIGTDGLETHILISRAGLVRFPFFIGGEPGSGELVFRYDVVDAFIFPEDFAASRASAVVGPTGTVAFSLQKNGVEFATVTFGDGSPGDVGTFAMTASPADAVTLEAGDIFGIVAPSPADATLADISISLAARRI